MSAQSSSNAAPSVRDPGPPPVPPIVQMPLPQEWPDKFAEPVGEIPPPDQAALQRPAKNVSASIPPPPPPRSTLPPVRPGGRPRSVAVSAVPPAAEGPNAAGTNEAAPDAAAISPQPRPRNPLDRPLLPPRSGIGATRGVRWEGQVTVAEPEPAEQESNRREVKRKLIDMAPSWLISTVIHFIAFIILALITLPPSAGLGKIFFEMSEDSGEDEQPLAEFDFSKMESDFELTDSEVENVEVIEMSDLLDAIEPIALEPPPTAFGSAPEMASLKSRMFGGRTGAMKQALLATYGGTQQTQDAVAKGLLWLQKNQLRTGAWSLSGPFADGSTDDSLCSATALAIMAFAGDGNTHQSGPYKEEVLRAVKFLTKRSKRGKMALEGRSQHRAYAQAQATIALCELYAMTGDSWLRSYCQDAIDYAADIQGREGGWRYDPRGDSDTSVTGWYLMAMQSALGTDLEVPMGSIERVAYYLDQAEFDEGAGYGYQIGRGLSIPMTAEGLLCRQYLGWKRNFEPMKRGIRFLLTDDNFDIDQQNVYYWYYATQLLHHNGGSEWRMWNGRMSEQLPAAQIRRGPESGSWAPQDDYYGHVGGRLYTTCLSIFCLEVYYRHMPLYGSGDEK